MGVTCHDRPGRVAAFLETGQVDVLMVPVNFVDDFIYGFEKDVLPLARKHNVGIVAMKVFGGASKAAGSYKNPKAPPELDVEHLELAVRYSLGIPGVATVNIGVHNVRQLRQNVELVKRFRPLEPDEKTRVDELGTELARTWGPHFGPVA